MNGIIDVGGGLRDAYGAGVFDGCLDLGITFDYCIGVSAGSGNLMSFLAGQKARNLRFYEDYTFRREYMSWNNYFRLGSYINLRYVYGVLSNSGGEDPLDFPAIQNNPSRLIVVATDARTGKPKYFDKNNLKQDDYQVLMASSCIPVFCRPYVLNRVPYYDGGISDPIPIQKAFDDGCDKVAVILTKPASEYRVQDKDVLLARLLKRHFPRAARNLLHRYQLYNNGLDLAKKYEKEGRALIISPDDCCGVDTLTKNRDHIQRLYEKGYHDAHALPKFLGT